MSPILRRIADAAHADFGHIDVVRILIIRCGDGDMRIGRVLCLPLAALIISCSISCPHHADTGRFNIILLGCPSVMGADFFGAVSGRRHHD